jgi:hypothetical protein
VPEAGLAGKKNGELLSGAEQAGFEVFVTLDQGIRYQQNLSSRKLAIILIRARSSRLDDILPSASEIIAILSSIRPGNVTVIGS